MALKLKVTADEYKKLDEGIKGLYEEKDGGYVLSIDGLEDTSGLKSALEKERKARSDFEKLSKAFQGLGKTPEEIAELLKVQDEAEKGKLEQKGEWEKLKNQLLEGHKKAIETKDEEVKKMRSALESYLVDAAATEAIASEKGIPQLLLPHVKGTVKVVEEEGKYHVRILGADGSPRVNTKGEFLGIKDLVTEMKGNDVFGRAFDGTGTGGGGAPSGAFPGGGKGFILSRADAADPMKYRAAKEAAQKSGQELQIAPE